MSRVLLACRIFVIHLSRLLSCMAGSEEEASLTLRRRYGSCSVARQLVSSFALWIENINLSVRHHSSCCARQGNETASNELSTRWNFFNSFLWKVSVKWANFPAEQTLTGLFIFKRNGKLLFIGSRTFFFGLLAKYLRNNLQQTKSGLSSLSGTM